LTSELLSEIELYYLPDLNVSLLEHEIAGQEFHHIAHVMKHEVGNVIHATDGRGNLYRCEIVLVVKKCLTVNVSLLLSKEKRFPAIWFCLPLLKSADRMEFCIEKLVEIGFTNFLYYRAKRSVSKSKQFPEERMEKIAIAAMQQSLNLWKPEITVDYNLKEIPQTAEKAKVVIFEAVGDNSLADVFRNYSSTSQRYYLLFGPEGGLTEEETGKFPGAQITRLTKNRLRAETAAIYTGSFLSSCLENAL
jgi:16S rRNA (uracil1498-N3)-methyltransferase